MKTGNVTISEILGNAYRVDPSFHLSDAIQYRHILKNAPYPFCQMSECSERVFMGNIFSRNFVDKNAGGVPYLSASDTVLRDLNTRVYLSKKQSEKLNYLMLEDGWILVTCSGTIGNVTYTNEDYSHRIATHDLIRIVPNDNKVLAGVLYAFLSSRYGKMQLTQSRFGGVVKHINCEQVSTIRIPVYPDRIQEQIDSKVREAATLRHQATTTLKLANDTLLEALGLGELSSDFYDYFGPRDSSRVTSTFTKSIRDIGTTTINAFNHSARIQNLKRQLSFECMPLKKVLQNESTFSTGQVSSVEVSPENGIMFINQSDIFNNVIEGKFVSKKKISQNTLVKYGEVLVACDGTLGESELFCKALFAGEELDGALVSSHFLRMKTVDSIPSGYLYCWLNTDYGFRLIRNTQAGTKLCHPISRLFLDIPVPKVDSVLMTEIDRLVRLAHTYRYQAGLLNKEAIHMVENLLENNTRKS